MSTEYEQGRENRDTGMDLAADAEGPEFGDVAFDIICELASRRTEIHVDDVLAICKLKPKHPNAWGSVWMRAIRAHIIEHSGRVRPCRTDSKKNAHQYPVYRSLVYGRWL